MWTYFLPAIIRSQEWVKSGRIGKILQIKADFGYPTQYDPMSRMYNPHLAGGVLLDMGIYPIAVTALMIDALPEEVKVVVQKAKTDQLKGEERGGARGQKGGKAPAKGKKK